MTTTNTMTMETLNDEMLEQVNGGMETSQIPKYGEIKQYYFEKGAQYAFTLWIFYHPTPFGYEVIEHIEKEIASGNRGYTIDGVYYDCPEHDPYFKNSTSIRYVGP